MTLLERIQAFASLATYMSECDKDEHYLKIRRQAFLKNNLFKEEFIQFAVENLAKELSIGNLKQFLLRYNIKDFVEPKKTVAIIMAGNIPMVGFMDFFYVLIFGYKALVKLSAQDSVLMQFFSEKLQAISNGGFDINFTTETVADFDIIIATGSNNTSRYFEYYFSKYPHIIRRNRSSCAVITNDLTEKELSLLAEDVFMYYGLGCRSVSKLFLPRNYDLSNLIKSFNVLGEKMMLNSIYSNNYDYNKSLILLNMLDFIDTSSLLLLQSNDFSSPIAVLYYDFYDDESTLFEHLAENKNILQCILAKKYEYIGFGSAQKPKLNNYADNIDVLCFLEKTL